MEEQKRHESYSSLALFDACPRRYLKVRVEKIPQVMPDNLLSGILVHKAIETYLLELLHSQIDRYAEGMMSIVEEIFRTNELATSTELFDDVLMTSRMFAKNYVVDYRDILDVESRYESDLASGYPVIVTIPDLIQRCYDGEGPYLLITDYKTGWGTTHTPSHAFQLQVQAWQVAKKFPDVRIRARNYYVRSNYYSEEYSYSSFDYEILEARLRLMIDRKAFAATSGLYPARPGEGCSTCPAIADCEMAQSLADIGAKVTNEAAAMLMVERVVALEANVTQQKALLKEYVSQVGPVSTDSGLSAYYTEPKGKITLPDLARAYERMGADLWPFVTINTRYKAIQSDDRLGDLIVERPVRPSFRVGKPKSDDVEESAS